MRECGDCTLCCELFEVKWLNKPINTKCKFCDKGCLIQDTKEDECRNFDCLYIESDMDESLRPDKIDVLFEKITTKIYLALNHYNNPKAYNSAIVLKYIKKLNLEGISVIASSYTSEPNKAFLAKGHEEEKIESIINNIIKNRNK